MKQSFLLALGLTCAVTVANAQDTDVSGLGAEDVLKLQIGAGQDRAQLEEQLADQLEFNDDNEFEARRKVKTYVEVLFQQAATTPVDTLTATLPVREITYDFDRKTYKLCLPSSLLYASAVEGGTAEALISFRFGDLAEKDADLCPHLKSNFTSGTTLGISNYMEISVEMAQAEQLHNAIEAGEGMASFTCDELTFLQGRFDTGPTQLVCLSEAVSLSVMGGPALSFRSGGDDSWITRSGETDDDEAEGNAMEDLDDGNAMAASADDSETDDARMDESDEIEPGTILTETALELDRADRIEVQRRLNLLGYSTRGVDGVFGPGTRAGISQWQVKNGMPISGYLSSGQVDILNVTSEALYQDWLVKNANASTTTTRTTTTKRKYYRGADGCLRTRPGNARKTIIPGQSKFCNQRRRGKR